MRHLATHIGTYLLLTLAAVSPAMADVINFEAQTVARGGHLTGIPDSPLTIDGATFTGGELLNAAVGFNADQTGVYASEGLFGSGETDPLVISFSSPVNNFSIYIVNGDAPTGYTVSDNLGESVATALASSGLASGATISLPGKGVTTVDITSVDIKAWIFAIDNVTFAPVTTVPEPASLLFMSTGCFVVLARRLNHPVLRRLPR